MRKAILTLALLVVLVPAAFASEFVAPRIFTVNPNDPNSTVLTGAVGDFNGDGKPDLVFPFNPNTGAPGSVSVLLGVGDGTFQPEKLSSSAGVYPSALAVGDFNGDGKLDVAVADNQAAGTVTIMLGNGDGTFQTGKSSTAGTSSFALVVGDFNNDGTLDVAVLAAGSANSTVVLNLFLGNGDGTLQPELTTALANFSTSFAAWDFNGDGKLDLVFANQQPRMSRYYWAMATERFSR